jgi:hypothetical protein
LGCEKVWRRRGGENKEIMHDGKEMGVGHFTFTVVVLKVLP